MKSSIDTLKILETFTDGTARTLTGLCYEIKMDKARARRHLQVLVSTGFLTKSSDKFYKIGGPGLEKLGQAYLKHLYSLKSGLSTTN